MISALICLCISLLISRLTFALHESLNVAVPISRLRLHLVHAVKVKVRHRIVFSITGHIHHLIRMGRVEQGIDTYCN